MLKLTRILLSIAFTGATALMTTPSQAEFVATTDSATSQAESVAVKQAVPDADKAILTAERSQRDSAVTNEKTLPAPVETAPQPEASTRQRIPCRIFPVPSMMQ